MIRLRKPLWAVRLMFVGGPVEIDGDPVRGGRTTRYVRATDPRRARQAALAEAKARLAELKPKPADARLLWSTEAIDETKRAEPTEFHLFGEAAPFRTDALREAIEGLADEDLRLEFSESGLAVVAESPDETTVGLTYEEMAYEVFAGPWHGHFADAEQALSCFRWLLTPFYRVGIDRQGDAIAATWIERYLADGWEPLHPVLFRNPTDPTAWMGAWTREYRQQAAVTPRWSYAEVVPGARLDERGFPSGTTLGSTELRFERSLAEEIGWLEEDYTFDPGGVEPPPGLE